MRKYTPFIALLSSLALFLPLAATASCSGASVSGAADGNGPPPGADGGPGSADADGRADDICKGACIGSIAQLAIGGGYACVLLSDGQTRCWGANDQGQLGRVPFTGGAVLQRPAAVAAIPRATSLAAGEEHACAIVDAHVRCWGDGWLGQLGNGAYDDVATPVEVLGVSGAIAVAAGDHSTCAIRTGGTVACWGANQGVDKDGLNRISLPVEIGISGAKAVGITSSHACALLEDGTVQCWGGRGMLGNGTPEGSLKPVRVVGISDATALVVGKNHTCVLLRNGRVNCWGKSESVPYSGQLGDGRIEEGSVAPVLVPGITDAVALSVGSNHTCALLSTKRIKCWGDNLFGQVGAGDYEPSRTPREVVGIADAAAIAVGGDRSCAILADATIRCWGRAGGGPPEKTSTPVVLEGVP